LPTTALTGTIGAKNQGKGIVGVAPGIGIYALRVLHADGNGLLSDLLRAYDHLVANARQLGIRVVNLSLSGAGRSTDEDCRYITELVQQGITVVTAAGGWLRATSFHPLRALHWDFTLTFA
jgi:subtilisin family serine protease